MGVDYNNGLENFRRFMRGLRRGGLTKVGGSVAYKTARKIEMLIRARYRELATASLSSGPAWAKRATAVGKESGQEREARLPQPEGWTVLAELATLVERVALGNTKHLIRIKPNLTFVYRQDRGPISHLMADWIENPKPMRIPNTMRSMIYRIMMQENRGGYGTRTAIGAARGFLPDKQLSGGTIYTPPKRPVWKKVASDLMKPSMKRLYSKDMLVKLRAFALQYGAK